MSGFIRGVIKFIGTRFKIESYEVASCIYNVGECKGAYTLISAGTNNNGATMLK